MNTRPAPPLQLPARKVDRHKGDFGRCLLIGGSRGMAGSISLSSLAALRTGSGLVTAAIPNRCLETVAGFHPCLMTLPLTDDSAGCFDRLAADDLVRHFRKSSSYDAIGCGPGMTTGQGATAIVSQLLDHPDQRTVLDADALNVIASEKWLHTSKSLPDLKNVVLTPHPGELHRLTGQSPTHRGLQIDAAQDIATRTGCIVVVKGGPTVVVSSTERWTNDTGNPGMATAGSGDVLTGIMTSLLGQHWTNLADETTRLSLWEAAKLGVWIHGLAGDLAAEQAGQAGMTALEILNAIPRAMRLVINDGTDDASLVGQRHLL